jgi:hypothetical protein
MILFVLSGLFISCSDGPSEEEIASRISNGEVVQVETTKSPIIIGCLGQPWCVCLDEERRAIMRKSNGELTVFCLNCSGVTYFSSDFYDYIYAESDDCDQFEEDIDAVTGLRTQVIDHCLESPWECDEGFPEECEEP